MVAMHYRLPIVLNYCISIFQVIYRNTCSAKWYMYLSLISSIIRMNLTIDGEKVLK